MLSKQTTSRRRLGTLGALGAGLGVALFCGGTASAAQTLTVLPVSITLPAGQLATTMTVINQDVAETSVQVRVLSWKQSAAGVDELTPSDAIVISPPIITIAPGATQVVRVVVRKPDAAKEGTYRILLDQIPPAAQPGTVRIALRLSIPIFVEPSGRAASHVAFHVEKAAGGTMLVGYNDGNTHATMRDVALATKSGGVVKLLTEPTPYILAGNTQRWRISDESAALLVGGTPLHLTGSSGSKPFDEDVPVVVSTSSL